MCVQKFDDSLGFAIRPTYRISLRPSSLWEPRHPPVRVVWHFARVKRKDCSTSEAAQVQSFGVSMRWLSVICDKSA